MSRTHDFRPLGEALNDATYLDQFLTAGEDGQAALDYSFGRLGATFRSGRTLSRR